MKEEEQEARNEDEARIKMRKIQEDISQRQKLHRKEKKQLLKVTHEIPKGCEGIQYFSSSEGLEFLQNPDQPQKHTPSPASSLSKKDTQKPNPESSTFTVQKHPNSFSEIADFEPPVSDSDESDDEIALNELKELNKVVSAPLPLSPKEIAPVSPASNQKESRILDIYGKPRKQNSIQKPSVLQSKRGSLNPNFAATGTVRLSGTASTKKCTNMDSAPRSLLHPESCDFDPVCLGKTFGLTLTLTNGSHGPLRFRVVQPAHPDIKVVHPSGAIAPGMSSKIQVHFSASSLGDVTDTFQIITEGDVFDVFVSGHVVPPNDYAFFMKNTKRNKINRPRIITH